MASSSLLLLLIASAACCSHNCSSLAAAAAVSVLQFAQPGSSSARFSTQQNASFWQTADFTLGFQRVADTAREYYLLCLWRSVDLDRTALWWPSDADFNHTALRLLTDNEGGETSPTVPSGTNFRFTEDGSLQLIYDDNDRTTGHGHLVLWSVGNNASLAELSNTGNLLLRNESQAIVWQSFGDRRDTMIMPAGPGISIDVDLVVNNSRLLQSRRSWNRTSSSFAAGRFHAATGASTDLYLHALEQHYGVDFMYTDGNIQVYADGYFSVWKKRHKYESNSSTGMSLVRLDPDSNLRVYLWSETKRAWQQEWQLLLHRCFLGGPCGPFGICRDPELDGIASIEYTCVCPPGYSPLDPLDASKGCGSTLNFTAICSSSTSYHNYSATAYSMTEVPNSDYDYGNMYSYIVVQDMADCLSLCLNDCKCSAAYFVASDSHCWLKGDQPGGILMNGYTISPDSGNMLFMKLLKGSVGSERSKPLKGAIVGAVIAGVVVLVMLAATAMLCAVRWVRTGWPGAELLLELDGNGGIKTAVRFTHQQLVEATDGFKHLLGEGGFGKVYKGRVKLKAPPAAGTTGTGTTTSDSAGGRRRDTTGAMTMEVAVKVLKGPLHFKTAGWGKKDDSAAYARKEYLAAKQFRGEVNTLGNIHHVNLVKLIGYCDEEAEGRQIRALVFEYMEQGSLDRYLSGTSRKKKYGEEDLQQPQKLAWERRYAIALDMARGIAYLHHECNPPILHSDIKPQNVLLDGQFMAKVADFGFARRFQRTKSHLTVSGMQGTRGYMAPEWLKTDEITSKVDVFSFGVVLLELVRGLCDCHRHHFHVRDADRARDAALPVVDWAFRYLQSRNCFSASSTSTTELRPSDLPSAAATNSNDAAVATKWKKKGMEREESAAAGDVGAHDHQAMDREQQKSEQKIRLLKVGLWCVQQAAQMRPSMQRVLRMMEAESGEEIEAPPFPLQMGNEWGGGSSSESKSNSFFCVRSSNVMSGGSSNDDSLDVASNFIEAHSALSAR